MRILFVLLLSAVILCSCERYEMPELPQPLATAPEIVDEDHEISEIPEPEKYNPTPSPDGKHILYNHSVAETKGLTVGVDTANGVLIHKINIGSLFSNDIMNLEWLGNEYFAVTTHVNPSTLEYFIYSLETGEELAAFKEKFDAFRIETLLSGEFDSRKIEHIFADGSA